MSLHPLRSRPGCRPPAAHLRRAGVALVIVLAFIALLTGLIVAYFARSMTSRQLANSSASQTRSALLARSASDIVIAGLKQEIAAGSFPTPTPSPSPAYPYYVPLAPANAVPVRYPMPAAGSPEPNPNLVRSSDHTDAAMAAPGVSSLASNVSSSTPATNGHWITPARWNSHYLLPSYQAVQNAASGQAISPSTPDSFTPPDWVLVSRSGPAARNGLGSGATALNNATPTNSNYVIGRYAYAIYDEGGLLDMNVAGHPTPTGSAVPTSSPPAGFTATQVGQKGSLAMADLTQLPIVKSPAAPTTPAAPNPVASYLSQAFVDSLVGWRNHAAGNPSGAFPNFTFSPSQANSWFTNFAYQNTTGFLRAYIPPNTTGTNAPTDQALLSRQQLLHLQSSIGFSANALQFMGTFSRSLEQPSYIPPHLQYPTTAPSINGVSPVAPPAAALADSYQGNNNAASSVGPPSGQDLINPSLLTIRVAASTPQWTRADINKTASVPGEPLLKNKFALTRLAEVTYDASDTSDSVTDLGLKHANHIKDWFGLARTSKSLPWTYNHGLAGSIMTLEQVAAANREPDFAELLKAAINVGSIAKGGPNLPQNNGYSNVQYTLDTSVDYQLLQIMANLIDQYDTDSYPTVIQIASGGIMRTFRGIEDLPYFYRYHPMAVVTRLPSPILTPGQSVDWWTGPPPTSNPTPLPATFATSPEVVPGNVLVDPGAAVYLYIPEVWNPHDAGTPLTSPTGARPGRFRMSVVTDDPTGQTTSWSAGAVSKISKDWYAYIPPDHPSYNPTYSCIPKAVQPLADRSTAFTFSDNQGRLFREPTLLWRADVPTNSNLQADNSDGNASLAGPYTDVNTKIDYYGLQIGQSPVSYTGVVDPAHFYGTLHGSADLTVPASTDGTYTFQGTHLQLDSFIPVGGYRQYTFRLEYQDPNGSGSWIVYDEKYADTHGLFPYPNLIVDETDDYNNGKWMNPYSAGQISEAATAYDPRTARFGMGTESSLENAGPPVLEPGAAANYNASTNAGNQAFAQSNSTVWATQRQSSDQGDQTNFSNPCMTSDPGQNKQMRWFSGVGYANDESDSRSAMAPFEYDGLLSQNNPTVNILGRDGATVSQFYYEDPDGVARRAMGAYALTGMLPASKTSAATQNLEGLPHATANTYTDNGAVTGKYGVGTPTAQNLSRPMILNRPFRSVAEMSYTFTGTPWKQLDFFTPESGDTALLDVFCVSEPPVNSIVAGKVNLNTHQTPVLQAMVAGTSRDELSNVANPPAYAPSALTGAEAANVAAKLIGITTDRINAWRGPLTNVGDLVGHYVNAPGSNVSVAADAYTFTEPVSGQPYTYSGLSAALDGSVYASSPGNYSIPANYKSQRLREAAVRALSDGGQTRVWNLMIDVIAQTGRYPSNATSLAQFAVDGEAHYWVHMAVDRPTGQVIGKQIELVSE